MLDPALLADLPLENIDDFLQQFRLLPANPHHGPLRQLDIEEVVHHLDDLVDGDLDHYMKRNDMSAEDRPILGLSGHILGMLGTIENVALLSTENGPNFGLRRGSELSIPEALGPGRREEAMHGKETRLKAKEQQFPLEHKSPLFSRHSRKPIRGLGIRSGGQCARRRTPCSGLPEQGSPPTCFSPIPATIRSHRLEEWSSNAGCGVGNGPFHRQLPPCSGSRKRVWQNDACGIMWHDVRRIVASRS